MTKKTSYRVDKWPMDTIDWINTFIVLGIPIIGQLFMIIWAFSSEQNQSKITLCRALLIINSILIAILFIIGIFHPYGGLKGFFSDLYVYFILFNFM